jgi:hypothetical protein
MELNTPGKPGKSLQQLLKQSNISPRNQVKIIGIETMNKSSQQVVLRLDIGDSRPTSVYTTNRGRDWQYLNR